MDDGPKQISCSFANEAALYLSYMPFVKGGGIFIRTNVVYCLGDQIKLTIMLLNEPDPYDLDGSVVWITPKGAQGKKPPGIGVQLAGENSRYFCNKVETYLAGLLKSTQPTDTM